MEEANGLSFDEELRHFPKVNGSGGFANIIFVPLSPVQRHNVNKLTKNSESLPPPDIKWPRISSARCRYLHDLTQSKPDSGPTAWRCAVPFWNLQLSQQLGGRLR